MHDPLVVAFEIRRPWPQKAGRHRREDGPRWEWRNHGRGRLRWLRPGNWSPFVTVAGRRWFFPPLVTIWHREPDGRDSGEVCKHVRTNRHGKRVMTQRWRWHVRHWRVQVVPVQKVRRWLFGRCGLCKRRFPYSYAPISHSWEGGPSYHHECSSLIHARQRIEMDERLVKTLFAALRIHTDQSEPELLATLTDPTTRSLEFALAYRLTGLLGYERDEEYRLVLASRANR